MSTFFIIHYNLSLHCTLFAFVHGTYCLAAYTNYLLQMIPWHVFKKTRDLMYTQNLFLCYLTSVGHLIMTKNIKQLYINSSTNNAKYSELEHLIRKKYFCGSIYLGQEFCNLQNLMDVDSSPWKQGKHCDKNIPLKNKVGIFVPSLSKITSLCFKSKLHRTRTCVL